MKNFSKLLLLLVLFYASQMTAKPLDDTETSGGKRGKTEHHHDSKYHPTKKPDDKKSHVKHSERKHVEILAVKHPKMKKPVEKQPNVSISEKQSHHPIVHEELPTLFSQLMLLLGRAHHLMGHIHQKQSPPELQFLEDMERFGPDNFGFGPIDPKNLKQAPPNLDFLNVKSAPKQHLMKDIHQKHSPPEVQFLEDMEHFGSENLGFGPVNPKGLKQGPPNLDFLNVKSDPKHHPKVQELHESAEFFYSPIENAKTKATKHSTKAPKKKQKTVASTTASTIASTTTTTTVKPSDSGKHWGAYFYLPSKEAATQKLLLDSLEKLPVRQRRCPPDLSTVLQWYNNAHNPDQVLIEYECEKGAHYDLFSVISRKEKKVLKTKKNLEDFGIKPAQYEALLPTEKEKKLREEFFDAVKKDLSSQKWDSTYYACPNPGLHVIPNLMQKEENDFHYYKFTISCTEDDVSMDFPQYVADIEVVVDHKKKVLNGGKPTLATMDPIRENEKLEVIMMKTGVPVPKESSSLKQKSARPSSSLGIHYPTFADMMGRLLLLLAVAAVRL